MANETNAQTPDDPAIVIPGPMLAVTIGVLALANFMAVLDMTIRNVNFPMSPEASPSRRTKGRGRSRPTPSRKPSWCR